MAGKFVASTSRDDTTSWDIEAVAAQLSFLQGEVLTIVDSLLPDGRQLKAAKDLVKGAFRNRERYMRDVSGGVVVAHATPPPTDATPNAIKELQVLATAVRNVPNVVLDVADDVALAVIDHCKNQMAWVNTITLSDGTKALEAGAAVKLFNIPIRTIATLPPGKIIMSPLPVKA